MNDTDLDGDPLDSTGIPTCPFCGSAARYFGPLKSGGTPRYLWEIQCRGCHASIQGNGNSSQQARECVLARWSRRATAPTMDPPNVEPIRIDRWLTPQDIEAHGNRWRWHISGRGPRHIVLVECHNDSGEIECRLDGMAWFVGNFTPGDYFTPIKE